MGIDSLEEKIEKGGIYNGGTGIGDARQLWCNINTHQALKPPYVFEMGDGTKLQIGLPYRIEYTVYSEELKDLVFEYWKKPEESGGHLSVNVDADTGKVTSVSYEMEPLVHHW